jgi:ABC-2 type transport system ATP-binding protein
VLAIEVESLVRTFSYKRSKGKGEKRAPGQRLIALDGVNICVEQGEVRGLLGPNGAGKTTLVKVLSTVLLPTSGRVVVLGHDVVTATDEVRKSVGVVFGGERGLYGRLSVRQNLEYWASAYRLGRKEGRFRVAELIEQFGLTRFTDTAVDRISRGMKQRVHLARGLLSKPALLFLDEPTIGMDPVAARELHKLLAALRDGTTTIMLTTHDMAEAEELCDRVTLIDHGQILGTQTTQEVGRWITAYERVEARIEDVSLVARLRDLAGVAAIEPLGEDWLRISTNSSEAVSDVLRVLVGAGITALRVGSPSLHEVYLELIGTRGMTV